MTRSLVFLLISLMSISAFGEIYRWKDANGKLHYSDIPPKEIKADSIEVKLDNSKGRVKGSVKNLPKFIYEAPKKRAINKKKVVMYGTSWCGYCARARKHFKENNISFVEHDVEKNPAREKEFKRLGGTGFPLIVIGKKKMMGFSADRFDKIYSM